VAKASGGEARQEGGRPTGDRIEELEKALFDVTWLGQKQMAASLIEHQLTVSQFFSLLFIESAEGGTPMGQLANWSGHTLATMTGIVDRLVRRGLVERARRPGDRRIVLVLATDAGRAAVAAARSERRAHLEEALSRLPGGDATDLVRVLDAFNRALGVRNTAGDAGAR
jgi:DNA-binding MarR family transcriptional regulator